MCYLDLGVGMDPLLLKGEKIPDVKTSVSHVCGLHVYLQSGRELCEYEIASCTAGDQVLNCIKTSAVLRVGK